MGPGIGARRMEMSDDPWKETNALAADAMREAALTEFETTLNTPGVSTGEVVLAASKLKQTLGSVQAYLDAIKTLTDDEKRILERAMS